MLIISISVMHIRFGLNISATISINTGINLKTNYQCQY